MACQGYCYITRVTESRPVGVKRSSRPSSQYQLSLLCFALRPHFLPSRQLCWLQGQQPDRCFFCSPHHPVKSHHGNKDLLCARVVPVLCLNPNTTFRRTLQSVSSSVWLLKKVIKKTWLPGDLQAAPGNWKLPNSHSVLRMCIPLAVPSPRRCPQDTALKQKCGVGAIWIGYEIEPS